MSLPVSDRLAALLDTGRRRIPAGDVAVVVAHPDDETIGCGARLARWRGATLVMVTDGAPASLEDARAQGFATAADYADARRHELFAALAIAGVPPQSLVAFDIPDQQAARRLVELTHRLVDLVEDREPAVIFTHAYEGGHPDHDATAFAVHAATRLVRTGGQSAAIVEMPFYRADATGNMVLQQFVAALHAREVAVRLTPAEQALKRRMMAAHRTQQHILAPFPIDLELFRLVPSYDFTVLPNDGRVLYEHHNWGLRPAEWPGLARTALAGLGLDAAPS